MDEYLQDMIEPRAARSETARRRRLWSTATVLGLAGLGLTSLTTGAVFTDNETVTSGTVTTGTVDIGADDAQLAVTVPTLAPGDEFTRTIPVSNDGSLQLRYAVSIAATPVTPAAGTPGTGNLADKLSVWIYGNATCTGPALGTVSPIPSATTALVGDPSVGAQSGDRVLAATTSETLCLRVAFALDANDDYQNTGARIALTFSSEQTVNND